MTQLRGLWSALSLCIVAAGAAACVDEPTESAGPLPDASMTTSSSAPTASMSDVACSADALSSVPDDDAGLPPPVAAMRHELVRAATECDYRRLQELAAAGSRDFAFSFGDVGGAANHWQRLEEQGAGRPLRRLVQLLNLPHGTIGEDLTLSAWPLAFTFERWDDVPVAERERLGRLYGDAELRRFADFGSYIGYRVGITADGEWLYFVAGD